MQMSENIALALTLNKLSMQAKNCYEQSKNYYFALVVKKEES